MGIKGSIKSSFFCTALLATSFLSGCASLTSQKENDPLEPINRGVYQFNKQADKYVIEPVAKGYQFIMPEVIDRGISNFFRNLDDVVVFVNDVLQLKLNQATSDAGRFLVNSTVGVLGFMDVATDMGLPKHNEDFGQTLGVWGVPTGPYLVLPFFGPSSPRGLGGLVGDTAMNPVSYISLFVPYVSTGLFVINTVDKRADNLGTEKTADEAAVFGRYEFFRDTYITKRKSLMLDGNVPEEEDLLLDLDEDFDDLDELD